MVYLLVYNNNLGDREAVKSLIESIPEIEAWRYDMPNCFYLSSDSSAQDLADLFLQRAPSANGGRFLITLITDNRQGYLPKDTWNFLRDNS